MSVFRTLTCRMCVICGVPRWHTERELLDFFKSQGVLHVGCIVHCTGSQDTEWQVKPTNAVVLTFAPNIQWPIHINLGLMRHEMADYTEPPLRCFKYQCFRQVAKFCRGEQRCKWCVRTHDFKMYKADFTRANCSEDQPPCKPQWMPIPL